VAGGHGRGRPRPATGSSLLETLRTETQAQTAVTGSYFLVGNALRLQAQVVDATTGAVLGAVSPWKCRETRSSGRAAAPGSRDGNARGCARMSGFATCPACWSGPPTYEAYRAFDRGIRLYNAQDYGEAARVLRESWSLDTTFLIPLVYAATASWNRGQFATTDSLVKGLRARQNSLSEYFDLNVTYLEHLLAGEGDKAYQVVRHAATLAPGSRAPYNAARLALLTNRPSDALTLLTTMDPDRGLMRGWQSYWTQLSHALHLTGDHERELGAMREMRRRYPESRVAIVLEARALAALGRHEELDSLLSRDRGAAAGHVLVQAAVLVTWRRNSSATRPASRALPGPRDPMAREPAGATTPAPGAPLLDGEPPLRRGTLARRRAVSSLAGEGISGPDRLRGTQCGERRAASRFHGRVRGDWVSPHRTSEEPGPPIARRILAISGDTRQAIDVLSSALLQSVDGWPWWHASALRDSA
jgi:hypothetical protein